MKRKESYNESVDDVKEPSPENGSATNGESAGDNVSAGDASRTDTLADESADDASRKDKEPEEHPAEQDEANDKQADLERQVAEWKDKYLRLQAEFDNYRKRTLREKMELVERGGADVIKTMLPVADDLDRALDAISKSNDMEALRAGVTLIAQKFHDALKACGVSEIEAKGLELDTDHHEAVARFQAGEEQRGKIIDVVQKGYKLRDRVLRFAKVVVGE